MSRNVQTLQERHVEEAIRDCVRIALSRGRRGGKMGRGETTRIVGANFRDIAGQKTIERIVNEEAGKR